MVRQPVIAIVGPTACGKTDLALEVAETIGGEIVSVDSMQVYRSMDIGTAKPTPAERARVRHHLIDVVDPDEPYHLGRFVRDGRAVMADLHRRGKPVLLVGGTGLYLRGLREGIFRMPPIPDAVRQRVRRRWAEEGGEALHRELARVDPEAARRIHPHDRQRICRGLEIYWATGEPWTVHLARQHREGPPPAWLIIGLARPREELYRRIDQRVEVMLEMGLEEEVRGLLARGYGPELPAMQSLGYRHVLQAMAEGWQRERLVEEMARDTRRYAKRQLTWFRRTPGLVWLPADDRTTILARVRGYLAGEGRAAGGTEADEP